MLLYEGNIWSLISNYHKELTENAIDPSLRSNNSWSNSSNSDDDFKHPTFDNRATLCVPKPNESQNFFERAGTLHL